MLHHFLVSLILYISIIGTSLLTLGIAKKQETLNKDTPTTGASQIYQNLTPDQKRRQELLGNKEKKAGAATQKTSACEQFKFGVSPVESE
jgi:hypothetical protein